MKEMKKRHTYDRRETEHMMTGTMYPIGVNTRINRRER
jgi:hypothetical protein